MTTTERDAIGEFSGALAPTAFGIGWSVAFDALPAGSDLSGAEAER